MLPQERAITMMDESMASFLKDLGIPAGQVELIEGEPPEPVDMDKLRAYYRHELDAPDDHLVTVLITHYRAWHDASTQVILEEAGYGAAVDDDTPKIANSRWTRRYALISGIAALAASILALIFWLRDDTVEIQDGDRVISLAEDGSLSGLEDFSSEWQAAASRTLSGELEAPTVITEIDGAIPVVRSEGVKLSPVILEPILTAVREQQPVLRWRKVVGAKSYRVEVRNAAGHVVAQAANLNGTQWKVAPPLERGEVYMWTLYIEPKSGSARVAPDPAETPAAFKILSKEAIMQVKQAEHKLRDSHLLQFVWYIRAGLLQDAEAQMKTLLSQNRNSHVLEHLQKTLRERRYDKIDEVQP